MQAYRGFESHPIRTAPNPDCKIIVSGPDVCATHNSVNLPVYPWLRFFVSRLPSVTGRPAGRADQEGLTQTTPNCGVSAFAWEASRRVPERLFRGLREYFSEAQIVELTLRITLCAFFNRVTGALGIDAAVHKAAAEWQGELSLGRLIHRSGHSTYADQRQ